MKSREGICREKSVGENDAKRKGREREREEGRDGEREGGREKQREASTGCGVKHYSHLGTFRY